MLAVESNVEAGVEVQVEETGVVTGLPKAKRKSVKADVFLATVMANVAAGKSIADVATETGLKVATVEQRISKYRTAVANSATLSDEQKKSFKEKTSFKRGSTGVRTSGAKLFELSGIAVDAAPADETAEQNPAETPAQ